MKTTAENAACRVLHVTEATGGGVRQHLKRIVPALLRENIHVDLLLSTRRAEIDIQDDIHRFNRLGCRIATFGGYTDPDCLIRGFAALKRCTRMWKPDLIHLHAARAGIFGRLHAASRADIPVIYSPHGLPTVSQSNAIMHRLQRGLERFLRGKTAGFVCVSEAEAQDARRQLAWEKAKIVVVENGLEPDFAQNLLPAEAVRQEWGIPGQATLIGFPARLVPQKDPGVLIDALARNRPWPSAVRVVFCGDGPLRKPLEKRAARAGLGHMVVWLGHVRDMPRRMRAFDVAILSSRYEGLSYALLESTAAGVPVIAADIPANQPRPAFRDAITRFPPGDPDKLAAALDTTLTNLEKKRQQAAILADVVKGEFSAASQAAKLSRYYRRWTHAR